jgi:hypothetical protein
MLIHLLGVYIVRVLGDVSDVSEVYTASILKFEVCKLAEYLRMFWNKPHGGRVGLVPRPSR